MTKSTKHFTFGVTMHTWGFQLFVGKYGVDAQFLCFWASWTR